jgi:hypothetical protein
MENDVKFGSSLLAILLVGASAAQSSFANAHRSHHDARGKAASSVQRPTAKGASDAQAKDGSNADIVPSPVSPTTDKAQTTNVKSRTPGNYQVRRVAVPVPPNAIPRNAIGVAIAPPKGVTASSGESFKPGPAASTDAGIGEGKAGGYPREQGIALKPLHPLATASIPSVSSLSISNAGAANRGKIDGASLIRPSVAPSGLGGPARPVAGINGTTLRPKH